MSSRIHETGPDVDAEPDNESFRSVEFKNSLLSSLTLYDVNTGKNRLRELFAAVPGLRDSLLAKPAKRFEEAFTTLMQRRMSGSGSSLSPAAAMAARNAAAAVKRAGDTTAAVLEQMRGRLDTGDSAIQTNDKSAPEDDEVAKVMFQREPFQRQNSSSSGASSAGSGTGGTEHGGTQEGKSSGHGSSCFSPPPVTLDPPDTIVSGGLASGHFQVRVNPFLCLSSRTYHFTDMDFQERVIAISNAPPVSLRRRADSGNWEIGQGSGGLVSCCAPVMNKDPENVWLACFGPGVPFNRPTRCESPALHPPPTNSLGIPLIRTASAEVQFSVLQDPNREDDGVRQEIKDTISLLNVLKTYNK